MPFSLNSVVLEELGPVKSMSKYAASLGHILPQVKAQSSEALKA